MVRRRRSEGDEQRPIASAGLQARGRRLRSGRPRTVPAREEGPQALEKALEWGDRIPIGVFFKSEHVPTFEERIMQRVPTYMDSPPALQSIAGPNGEPRTDLTRLIERMTFKGA